MGTWGYGPFDSDNACDLVAELHEQALKPVKRAANAGPRRAPYSYESARAGIELALALCKLGGLARLSTLGWADRALSAMLVDKGWLDGWKDKHEAERLLRRRLAEVRRLLRAEEKKQSLRRVTRKIRRVKGKKRA